MAAALLTAIFASITGIAASMYLGFNATGNASLAQHISIGIFSTMITLLAHSMMMFYFLGKAKAVREAAAEGGLSKDFERRIAVARAPVFSIATIAMVATMVSGAPPHNQSRSVRFGKPGAPPPSEPWQVAQLLRNRLRPTFSAAGSCAVANCWD